jgi:multidrug resistance efflux pump
MKKSIIGILLVAALGIAAFSFAGCGGAASTTGAIPAASASPIPIRLTNRVIAEAKVVPVRGAALSFQTGGNVAELGTNVGDRVESGKLLARLDTRQLELSLSQSDANLAAAQSRFNQIKRGPTAEDSAAAQQNLISAQAAYEALLHPGESELVALKAECDKVQALVNQAQAAYDRIGGDSNPFSGMTAQRAQLQIAQLDQQKAMALYSNKISPTSAQVQQALASVQNAKSQLAKLQPTVDDLATAQANVNAAQAARDLIAEQIKNAKLVAPFAGVVIALDLHSGEYVAPGIPVVRVADASSWQVETTDFTELNVINIHEGDPAIVRLDAIPDLELPGKVSRIKGYGENRQGDVVYTLTVALDKSDERLRWNMTAKVTIEPKP